MKVDKKEQAKVDKFNAKHAVGDKVMVEKDDGTLQECVVRAEAEVMSGHTAVGWLTGISGAYLLDRVQ